MQKIAEEPSKNILIIFPDKNGQKSTMVLDSVVDSVLTMVLDSAVDSALSEAGVLLTIK